MEIGPYPSVYLLISLIAMGALPIIQGDFEGQVMNRKLHTEQRAPCPDSNLCMSQWGYCGTASEYCGDGCQSGPCWSGSSGGNINNGNNGGAPITGQTSACPDANMCSSKWGYCGTGEAYCGEGCTSGPCWSGSSGGNGGTGNNGNGNNGNAGDGSIITEQNFACVFNTIDAGTRSSRLTGLRNSGWKPSNKEEAAVFLAHVFHETDGLKVIREYCAPGIYHKDKQ